MQRRHFLRWTGALPLAGCACPRPFPPATAIAPGPTAPLLAPGRIQPKSVPLAIDVHTHLFNATDVPVRGFLEGPVAHSLPAGLAALVRAAAPLLELLGRRFALSCGEEMQQLAAMRTSPLGQHRASWTADLDRAMERHIGDVTAALQRTMRGTAFEAELDRAEANYAKLAPQLRRAIPLSQDEAALRTALAGGERPAAGTWHPAQARQAQDMDPLGILRFIGRMLSPRHHNLRAYQRLYSTDDGAFGVDLCCAAMVDYNRWLGCTATPSSLEDQVLLFEQLSVLSGGYMLPIVPYNPWTDIDDGDRSYALVRRAIERHGHVAVKIYPPIGYAPDGSVASGSTRPSPAADAMHTKLARLYQYCVERGIPVMAHTAHSNGRDKPHDELAAPHYWDKVLPDVPGLQVHAGHFGNHADASADWPGRYVRMMGSAHGRQVYADLAYLDDMLLPGPERDRMRALLSQSLPDGAVYRRVMYGSDWHMLAQIAAPSTYAHAMAKLVAESAAGAPAMPAVFGTNAAACFGFRQGQPNRGRIDRFMARWGLPTPPWLQQLDAMRT